MTLSDKTKYAFVPLLTTASAFGFTRRRYSSPQWWYLHRLRTIFHSCTTTILRPFIRDHPGEPVPEENFWTLWRKGRLLTEADVDQLAGRHSVRINQCPPPPSPHILQAGCPSCHPTNSVKALKACNACSDSKKRSLIMQELEPTYCLA